METFTSKSNCSNKRRRITSAYGATSINDLTNDNLEAIADFLPKTSRALFAVALTASALSWRERGWKGQPTEASKAIISSVKRSAPFSSLIEVLCGEDTGIGEKRPRLRLRNGCVMDYNTNFKLELQEQLEEYYKGQWEILDFVDVEKSLASKLTDDDIGAILVCIDAKNTLKRLKLTHCFNVVGYGLEPLRYSTVLENVNMGLVRQFEQPKIFHDVQITEDVVFPILHDIIGVEGSSFWRLQVPLKWYSSSTEGLEQFLDKHEHILNSRSFCCYFGVAGNEAGFFEQMEMGADRSDLIDTCMSCDHCEFRVCDDCNKILCDECCEVIRCDHCGEGRRCFECNGKFENAVRSCSDVFCDDQLCDQCRLESCRLGYDCAGCRALIFDKIVEEVDAKQATIDEKQDEIEKLYREVEELRERNA